MSKRDDFSCADCASLSCRTNQRDKFPSFCLTRHVDESVLAESLRLYREDPVLANLALTSAMVELDGYGRLSRVEETIDFIKRMGYRKVGIATCVGLINESRIFAALLRDEGIVNHTVGCKIGATDKCAVGVGSERKLNGGQSHESMCNPVMQALALKEWGADFCVLIGLCVGHDSMFLMHAPAPVTVMIVKDRSMGNNPVAALYTAGSTFSRFRKKKSGQ